MAKILQSIEQVEDYNIIDTGCKPILVLCNDFEFYVCKYNTTQGNANLLFREFMAASFLHCWALKVPAFALVNLQKYHNPTGIQRINNNMPCFGSLHNNEYREVDAFISVTTNTQRQKITNKLDFLKIALFDYWLANEDRNSNNYNLMLHLQNDFYHIIPIDGGAVFHTGNQDKQNYTLSYEETLISSPFLFSVFKVKELLENRTIDSLKQDYYFCVQECKLTLQVFIDLIPAEWQIDKLKEFNNLVQFLFNESWIDDCWQTFLNHLQLAINAQTNGKSV